MTPQRIDRQQRISLTTAPARFDSGRSTPYCLSPRPGDAFRSALGRGRPATVDISRLLGDADLTLISRRTGSVTRRDGEDSGIERARRPGAVRSGDAVPQKRSTGGGGAYVGVAQRMMIMTGSLPRCCERVYTGETGSYATISTNFQVMRQAMPVASGLRCALQLRRAVGALRRLNRPTGAGDEQLTTDACRPRARFRVVARRWTTSLHLGRLTALRGRPAVTLERRACGSKQRRAFDAPPACVPTH